MEDPVWRQMLFRQLVWTQEVCRLPNVRVALRVPDLSTGLAFRRDTPMLGNIAWHAARFLGDDQYVIRVLHFDQRPLVDFHAAVYYSNLHGAQSLKHVAGFLLDVGLGTVLGVLFGRLWAWYARARMAMDQTVATSLHGMVTKAPSYFRARGVLLMNLILQIALIMGMFVVAYALLRVHVWINPLPLVVGMSIKGLLASRQLHVGQEPQDWWGFYNRHPDVPLQVLIVVVSLGFAWYFGH
jgi:hypothetical protein